MARSSRDQNPAAAALNPAAWPASLIFAAVATAVSCYAAWPGYMSYDSLFAYRESLSGIETGLWPPMHAYLFALSRALGAGVGGLFALQTFLLFASAAVIVHLLVRSRARAALLCVAFAISFIAVPSQIGTLSAHWRDVPTASFSLLGLALWLLAARGQSRTLLGGAIAAFGLAVSLRYNAFVLDVGIIALMLWRPFLDPDWQVNDRRFTAAVLCLALGAAWASTHWRLPDFRPVPAANSIGGTQEFDVIGISACAGRSYLPESVTSGAPISPRQIRQAYDPRHLQMTLAPKQGVPPLTENAIGADLPRIWRYLLTHETGCYLAHRAEVLVEQMGMDRAGIFYPTHARIDDNPYGFRLAHPAASDRLTAYVETRAVEAWRRPYPLYPAAAIAVLLAAWRRRDYAPVLVATLVGCFAYPALLFIAAPAADARYIFPSNVFCSLLIVICAGLLGESRQQRPAGGAGD